MKIRCSCNIIFTVWLGRVGFLVVNAPFSHMSVARSMWGRGVSVFCAEKKAAEK